MERLLIPLHVTGAAIVIGVLFLQSMMIVMMHRLETEEQRSGVRMTLIRVEKFIYYPILAVTLLTGLYAMRVTDALRQGVWLHYKFIFLIVLIGLGLMVRDSLRKDLASKGKAMGVHVLIFIVGFCVVYLAVFKP